MATATSSNRGGRRFVASNTDFFIKYYCLTLKRFRTMTKDFFVRQILPNQMEIISQACYFLLKEGDLSALDVYEEMRFETAFTAMWRFFNLQACLTTLNKLIEDNAMILADHFGIEEFYRLMGMIYMFKQIKMKCDPEVWANRMKPSPFLDRKDEDKARAKYKW